MFEKKRKEIKFTKKVATTDNIEKQWKKVQRFQKERKKGKPTQKKKKSNKKEQKQNHLPNKLETFLKDSKQSDVRENFTTESPNCSKNQS